ncbi:prolyl oligopeptidase family serine peptidase [Burkholderia sp. FERM BP-3421]|uniref:alpha/beta hydrolase family protein n=1 Tax=Burkholderia sp. FERM BP-3421 TaxID=1494466 RepID=UPI00236009D2|nr:prolyl oligopeptidase family serine peptidase [Burkholderia sp. FERM BP-3421]WDD92505.1 prolyl oligopeptidase family serine peptidase [Burkholderia sp. FERM BP-3421]
MIRICMLVAAWCIGTSLAQAAGFQFIEIPGNGPLHALKGAVWYPCKQAPRDEALGPIVLSVARDCPVTGERHPLVVISHGRGGAFLDHADTAQALADAGFVVAAINHPGDNATDATRINDFPVLVERPADIKRLIDFMLGSWRASDRIDANRIGIFGFSRGGYSALVAIGAEPSFGTHLRLCDGVDTPLCDQVRKGEPPALAHDPRIKAAVIADPVALFFSAESFSNFKIPVQLWRSELGGGGVTPESVANLVGELPAKPAVHVVPHARHFSFMAPCSAAFAQVAREICADEPDFDRGAFHRAFNGEVLAFFRQQLTRQGPS